MHNNNNNYSLHTQFENRFFNLVDHYDITIHGDSIEFSIDKMEIYRVFSSFKDEILENITFFDQPRKTSYLKRILDRLNSNNCNCLTGLGSRPRRMKIFICKTEFKPLFDFEDYCRIIEKKKFKLIAFINSLIEPGLIKEISDSRPVFNHPELLTDFIEIIHRYFSPEQRPLLITLLKTGIDSPLPLIFHGNGNTLADCFKQLYNAGVITGCDKKQLESWILRNFRYTYRHKAHQFNGFYLSKIISTNIDLCHKPIIDVFKSANSIHIKMVNG